MLKTQGDAGRSEQSTAGAGLLERVPVGVLTLALVLAVTWVLSACGGGGGAPEVGGLGSVPDVTVNQEPPVGSVEEPTVKRTLQASQPGELLAYVKSKLEQRQQLRAERKSNYLDFSTTGDSIAMSGAVFSAGVAAPPPERSSTVIQEEGVDEDDTIKSNGSIIATLKTWDGAELFVDRVLPSGRAERAGKLPLTSDRDDRKQYTGMYLTHGPARAAVLGSDYHFVGLNICAPEPTCSSRALLGSDPFRTKSTTLLDLVNLANPASPVVTDRLRIDGTLVGSRLIGNSLVLVTQFRPALTADVLPWNAPAAEREAAIKRVTVADLLPTISINHGPGSPLVQETDCFIEPKNASYGVEITSITVLDLSSPTLQRSSRCFIGGSDALYMSTNALYLATTGYAVQPLSSGSRLVYPSQISTDIHKFAFIKGSDDSVATVDFRGSGSVIGHLGWSTQQRPYRMSEYNGHLRVLTFTGQSGWGVVSDAGIPNAPAPSPATLTVLREAATGKALQVVGQLPNKERPQAIGKPGEQVYAVRFMGDRGYVVTFRRVDPLYILDLSKPNDPKTTGELTIAGYSDYLFPVGPAGSGLLLGVGKDADERGVATGVKVALFDVADPANPTQKSSVTLGSSGSYSALDSSRHGIDLFTRGNQTRVVLPVRSIQYSPPSTYSYSSALQRFEVDATSRSMTLLSPLAQSPVSRPRLGEERTLQIGDMVHHFMPGSNASTTDSYTW